MAAANRNGRKTELSELIPAKVLGEQEDNFRASPMRVSEKYRMRAANLQESFEKRCLIASRLDREATKLTL